MKVSKEQFIEFSKMFNSEIPATLEYRKHCKVWYQYEYGKQVSGTWEFESSPLIPELQALRKAGFKICGSNCYKPEFLTYFATLEFREALKNATPRKLSSNEVCWTGNVTRERWTDITISIENMEFSMFQDDQGSEWLGYDTVVRERHKA